MLFRPSLELFCCMKDEVFECISLIQRYFLQMQIKSGRYHTLLISDSDVYCCGSSLCGVLGHGPETTQCVAFSRISFPCSTPVIQVSASHNHAAFVTQSGEVCLTLALHTFCCFNNMFISYSYCYPK